MLYTEAVPEGLLKILNELMLLPKLKEFRLVGGTAMALQCGHRESVDIDLFTDHSFSISDLSVELITRFNGKELVRSSQGVAININDVKVDLYNWAIPFIDVAVVSNGLRLASLRDIAAFKLDTICSRKEKKDFFDLYFLLKKMTFEQLMHCYGIKYPIYSPRLPINAVSSVHEADSSEQPNLLIPVSWDEVKTELINAVQQYEKNIIAQKEIQIKERENNIRKLLQKKRGENS